MREILLTTICRTFSTSMDAVALDTVVRKAIDENQTVVINFHGVSGLTSSFLSGSFGNWIDLYGFEILKDKIIITNYTPYIAQFIRQYLDNSRNIISK